MLGDEGGAPDSDHINKVLWSPLARSIRYIMRVGLVRSCTGLRKDVSHRIWILNFVSVPLLGGGLWSPVDTDFNIKGRFERNTSRLPAALVE